jgi:hypothetical protein
MLDCGDPLSEIVGTLLTSIARNAAIPVRHEGTVTLAAQQMELLHEELVLSSSLPCGLCATYGDLLLQLRRLLTRNQAGLSVPGCYILFKHLLWEELDVPFPYAWDTEVPRIMKCGGIHNWDLDWDEKCLKEYDAHAVDLARTVGNVTRQIWQAMRSRAELTGVGEVPGFEDHLSNLRIILKDLSLRGEALSADTQLERLRRAKCADFWSRISRRYCSHFGIGLPKQRWVKNRKVLLGFIKYTYWDYTWPEAFATLGDIAQYLTERRPAVEPWLY